MPLTRLYSGSASSATGDTKYPQNPYKREYGTYQVTIASAGTVVLQGRLSDAHSWVTIKSSTATEAIAVLIFPQMRVTTSGVSGGTVTAEVNI